MPPQILPSGPTPGALAALEAAEALADQTKPAVWFDSWSNDGRDNNLDGKIDDAGEGGSANADGAHYSRTYAAGIAPLSIWSVDSVPSGLLRTIDVTYKVCIDVAIESYKAAKVPVSHSRWIPAFFGELKHKKGWVVWDGGRQPDTLMDGDVVAASNPKHQHAGIVKTGLVYDSVINLPGPTSSRRYGIFRPSGYNDMVSVPKTAFEAVLSIDLYARWIGT